MTSPATSHTPRIFVSHSHEDDDYCRAYVAELRRLLGVHDAVWYDEHNMGSGRLGPTIEREIRARSAFVVILSSAALRSRWVEDETRWAYGLLRKDSRRTILPVTASTVQEDDIWLFLQDFKRIEAPNLQPYPPQEAARRTIAAIPGAHAVQATSPSPSPSAPARVAPAPQAPTTPTHVRAGHPDAPAPTTPAPTPRPPAPILPPDQFPPRFASLGFALRAATDATDKHIPYILPPLCPVPAGPFIMGNDPRQDSHAQPEEQPQHDVTLPAYQIARYPVTVAEYACFVRSGHAEPRYWAIQQDKLDHPVVWVSWHDAVAYAVWLATLTGQPWRLPTEAEWEKAARWDQQRRVSRIYPWGDNFYQSRAITWESRHRSTTSVGSYPTGASPYGAQDMAGNVWEWCSSLYRPYPYNSTDGRELIGNSTENRVLRGGSWHLSATFARAAYRLRSWAGDRYDYYGFRLALAAPIS